MRRHSNGTSGPSMAKRRPSERTTLPLSTPSTTWPWCSIAEGSMRRHSNGTSGPSMAKRRPSERTTLPLSKPPDACEHCVFLWTGYRRNLDGIPEKPSREPIDGEAKPEVICAGIGVTMVLGEIMRVGASIGARVICERAVVLMGGFPSSLFFWASFCSSHTVLSHLKGNVLFAVSGNTWSALGVSSPAVRVNYICYLFYFLFGQ